MNHVYLFEEKKMKKKTHKLVLCGLASILVFCLLLLTMSWAQEAEKIMFKLKTQTTPSEVKWIGILQGTWKEMGIQYGERAAKDIRTNFDFKWKAEIVKQGSKDWQKIRATEEERAKYAIAYMRGVYQEYSYLTPEITEFMEGIAEGAAEELNKSVYADVCTNFEKLGYLNFSGMHLHPGVAEDHCNGLWVKGEATKTGETYACNQVQSGIVGTQRSRGIAYVAIPKDPNARVFWSEGRAGHLGGIGGLINDYGVCVLTSGGQQKEGYAEPDETLAPGIKDFLLAFYGVVFSKTAREAVDRITIGTPKYRALTGRKTVLRARGCNLTFADANEAYCVESNALHYAIRTPGYLGEKGGNYLVQANHFHYSDGSYDENNIFHADEPMTRWSPEHKGNSSYYRFWTGMWNCYNNYGKIDREMMLRDIVTAHYAYDKDGKRYDPDPVTGAPTVPGTFCAHSSKRTEEYPLGKISGDTSVFVLTSAEVYWVPAFPCHYKDKSWNYLDLKPFSLYRKMLWGY